jgi:hypothetical protein
MQEDTPCIQPPNLHCFSLVHIELVSEEWFAAPYVLFVNISGHVPIIAAVHWLIPSIITKIVYDCICKAEQQPELNLPLLTCTQSMPNIRVAKFTKAGLGNLIRNI